MKKRKMPETQYRASRVCRILGNPTAYQIIKSLSRGEKTPSLLAAEIDVSVPTISDTLRNLRNIDVVRYEAKLNERIYWLKDATVLEIMDKLEVFVKHIRCKEW
jgi:DNA-binding transcriptional ArsR family regulator